MYKLDTPLEHDEKMLGELRVEVFEAGLDLLPPSPSLFDRSACTDVPAVVTEITNIISVPERVIARRSLSIGELVPMSFSSRAHQFMMLDLMLHAIPIGIIVVTCASIG